MNRGGRRLWELIFPPRYPQYEEYRSENDSDLATSPGSPGAVDETTLKMQRVKLVAAVAVLISLGVGSWLFFGGRSELDGANPQIQSAITSEVLKTIEPDVVPPKRDSIDDIKRWASDIEKKMEHAYDDSSSAPPMPPYYGQGPVQNMELPPVVVPMEDSSGYLGSTSPPAPPSAVPVAPRPTESPRSPAAAPPEAIAVDPGASGDSPANPYQRRPYEPVRYEPRNVSPY